MSTDKSSQRDLAHQILKKGLLGPEELTEKIIRKIDGYVILSMLGEGATSQVYLAKEPDRGEPVAIKVLDRFMVHHGDRFRQEIEILKSLRHSHIVPILDAGVYDERPYFVMEHVGVRTFADVSLPLADSVHVLEVVAEACQGAHDQGTIHRDLKPANIMMGDGGLKPVVCDFGLGKVLTEEAGVTRTGDLLGTPVYMAPEQFFGRDVDARTDIYAMGVMLYEVLTGTQPFIGESVLDISDKVKNDDPVPPRSFFPSIPEALEAIALKALSKSPDDRFSTAGEFAEALRTWRESS